MIFSLTLDGAKMSLSQFSGNLSGNNGIELTIPISHSARCESKILVDSLKGLVASFEIIFDNSFSGIIFCDKDCNIIYMNKFYADLLGINKSEAIGKHIRKYFPSSRVSIVLRTGKIELEQRCSLRTNFNLNVNRIPIKANGETIGVVLQTIFSDVNEINNVMVKLKLLEKQVKFYESGLSSILSASHNFKDIVGENKLIVDAKKIAEKYAKTDGAVLILGDTGTGKELFAHSIHMSSSRSKGPFVCVNCAAIPKDLLESELFGYEPGAFTGAQQKGKTGKIQLAHKGTLFLDEICEIPVDAQAKILRVLETKKVEKLGGLKSIDVDFRLVAATNRNIKHLIEHKMFREDLYYRLNAMIIEIPPLSARVDDIPELIGHFVKSIGKPEIKFSEAAIRLLKSYSWPGNVRELKNTFERAVSLYEGDVIDIEHLPREIKNSYRVCNEASEYVIKSLSGEMARLEKEILIRSLKGTSGNMSKTSKLLGISRSTLYKKCYEHHILKLI